MGSKKARRRKKKSSFGKNLVGIIIIICICYIIYNFFAKNVIETISGEVQKESQFKKEIFEMVESTAIAEVDKYIVYGTHFNIEGTLELDEYEGTISDVNIVLKGKNIEKTVNTIYSVDEDTITFSSGDTINDGLDLESLEQYNYCMLIKVTISDETDKYYSLENETEYGDIDYYTITKNNSNNEININFDEYNSISFLWFDVEEISELPDDVYDVVIDAGHGGTDVGAVNGYYYESEIVLDYALDLKTELENLGLKVFLTRDGTEDEDTNMAYTMYDDDGRVTTAMESGAKILLSIHINSNSADLSNGGVEVYAPSNCNLSFAKLLASNIVTTAGTNYSTLESYKEANGVYVRNYTESEIKNFYRAAIEGGYEPYNITTSTPYLFMIRETGGIATNAFVDGRNASYSANKYYDSNVGLESYLIELGYIIIDDDLYNMLYNRSAYVEAIADSIEGFYL